MGLVSLVMDWSRVKKMKAGLLDALRKTQVGAGISLTMGANKEDPGDVILSRALIELLKEHPTEIEMTDFGFSVTIMRKIGMVKSMTRESYDSLTANHGILTAESVLALGLKDRLPAHHLRGGVPADINEKKTDTSVPVIIKEP